MEFTVCPASFHPRTNMQTLLFTADLTTQSQLHEYKASIHLLQAINAPLKLITAGNHDFTMDIAEFHKRMAEAQSLERELVGLEGKLELHSLR